jgi:hypothetical protein
MAATLDSKQDHLLASLPEADLRRWRPKLELVEMPVGPSAVRELANRDIRAEWYPWRVRKLR